MVGNKMNRKAQITMEASLVIAIVVAGLLAMQGYLRRAIQGSWKTNTDSFSDEQFRPAEDQLLGEIDPDPTEETVSELKFIDSKITVENVPEPEEDAEEFGTLNIVSGPTEGISGSDILRINDWGTYYNAAEHEDED